jgi:hypothetical protein
VARRVRLTPRFLERLRASGVQTGSDASAAVGATLSGLAEAAELPGLLDVEALVPPTSRALVRRVAGRNLWVWYRVEVDEIVALLVTKVPPVPAT